MDGVFEPGGCGDTRRDDQEEGPLMSDNSAVTREQVFQYIVDYKRQHDGLSPTITAIAQALFMNRTTARYHLMMLEHDGRIRLVGRRAIQVIGGAWDLPEGDESPESGPPDGEPDAPDEHSASR
jgi:hypothetical protein